VTAAPACSDCDAELKPNPRRLGTRCRRCNARQMATSPEKRAKCRATMKRLFEDPMYRARHRQRTLEGNRRAMEKPEVAALRREQGRRVGLLRLGASRLPAGSPPRVQAGRKRTETVLAWCPLEYRDEYRRLRCSKLIRAPEARRMIEAMIARDVARYAATGRLPQSERLGAGA
jgi:hypothetical protein